MEVAVPQASLAQHDLVRAAQVEQPLAAAVRSQDLTGAAGAEAPPHRLGDFAAHLIAVRRDRGADPRDDVPWLAAEGGHRLDRRLAHSRDRAPPPGVHAAQHVRDRIVEHDRHAVRHHDDERDAGLGGHQGVCLRDGVVLAECAPAAVGGRDDVDVAAMRLVTEDQVTEVRAEGGGSPPPVLKHRLDVVANVQAEVERLIRAGGDTALPGRHQDVNRVLGKGRPGQHVKLAAPSQFSRRI